MSNHEIHQSAGFYDLTEEEKATLKPEKQVCLALLKHDELQGEIYSNSILSDVFAAEMGIDLKSGTEEEQVKAKKELAKAISKARGSGLVKFEMAAGGIIPSVTPKGQADIDAFVEHLRQELPEMNGDLPVFG